MSPDQPLSDQPCSASAMTCREGCAACCIAPSISSPMPGLPRGKPAGVPCPHLDEHWRCQLFGRPERPAVCSALQPSAEMCGTQRSHAMLFLRDLEAATAPATMDTAEPRGQT